MGRRMTDGPGRRTRQRAILLSIAFCLISKFGSLLMLYISEESKIKLTGIGGGENAKTASGWKQMNPTVFQRSIICTITERVGEEELI